MRASSCYLSLSLLLSSILMAAEPLPAGGADQGVGDSQSAPGAPVAPHPKEVNGGRRTADGEQERNAATSIPEAGDSPSSSSPSAVRRPPLAATRSVGDRLELDTTVVTGNRELPKVLYIVPWKKADLGDLPGQPFNTLLDEVLEPVDRDVFRREVTYFDAVTRGASATQSTSADPR